ncbi:MAG: Fe-S cluster assembly protein NifU [Victivallaceae bacterium]|jgi:NifU-like protein|nr:Fe-S cluster assembly protein NifU [Victivallaceae bacterium]
MWDYTDKVMDHFLHPRNVGEIENPDAIGEVGNISCGDALKLTLKLDEDGRIVDAKFKTFGCASAIASSSALTEIIKGLTLEEAAKITNRDIVEMLGQLPEEKVHCSVMGMEALQAAIANYKGETTVDEEDDHEGRIICHCFGVTDHKIRKVAKENNLHTVEEITNYTKAGGGCGMCIEDIQEILDQLWSDKKETPAADDDFKNLSTVQKILRIQQVLETEVKPMLEKDGGSLEFVDLEGTLVKVRMKGRCSSCPSSGVTLKYVVQDKLRELISPDLTVEGI